jgi:hypothetical protein
MKHRQEEVENRRSLMKPELAAINVLTTTPTTLFIAHTSCGSKISITTSFTRILQPLLPPTPTKNEPETNNVEKDNII